MAAFDFKNLITQLKELWNKFTRWQKILIVGGSIGLTLAIIGTVLYLNRPHWGLLYRGLDAETAGVIIQYLKDHKIPYKVSPDGGIYVPQDKVAELRLEIASKGLVGGTGPGFELFDKQKLGMTEFEQRINYQRALEGELERTILAIKGIKKVRVHIVLPKESVFISREEPAKASVLIETKPGFTLTKDEIKGIVNLVSGAVPGLSPQNVVIVDARTGKTYTLPGEEEELTTTQLAMKRKLEYDLKNKIEELLGKALGYGKVVAQVSVELSFDKEKITQEQYDPEGKVVVSEEIDSEKKISPYQGAGGVAGVKGTLEQKFEATRPGETRGEYYEKQKVIRNYDVSKTIKDLEISPGQIKRISVAVLVDKSVLAKNATQKIAWIEDLVKGAIGYNPDRGDMVQVEAMNFFTPPTPKPGVIDYILKLYQPILLFLVIILFFIFVVRPLIKHVLAPAKEPVEEEIEEIPSIEEVEKKEEIEEFVPQEVAMSIVQNPEKAALLVKKWLMEESLEERKKALAEAK